jgi:polyphosphate kinase
MRRRQPSGITLKLNNLVDKGLVDRLYAASSSGVPVNLLIRGMCSLIPDWKASAKIFASSALLTVSWNTTGSMF